MLSVRDIGCGVVVVAAGFGVGFGWAKGRTSEAGDDAGGRSGDGTAGEVRAVSALTTTKGAAVSSFAKLSRDSRVKGSQRLRAQLELVRSVDADEIPRMVEEVSRDVIYDMGRELLLKVLAKRWAESDPVAALQAVLAQRPKAMREVSRDLIKALAQEDDDECWALLLSHRHGRNGERHLGTYLAELADWEPDLALARAAELDPVADRATLVTFLSALAGSEPERVLKFSAERPGALWSSTVTTFPGDITSSFLGKGRTAPYRIVAHEWAAKDPQKAVQWFESLDAQQREGAVESLVRGWSASDPEAAVTYVFENVPPDRQQGLFDYLLGVGVPIPISFETRLKMAEVGEGNTRGRGMFVGDWMREDVDAATAWVAGRPEGERDPIIDGAIRRWANGDLESAAVGVGQIDDPQFRAAAIKALQGIGLQWGVRSALRELELAPDVRAAVEAMEEPLFGQ